MTPLRSRVLRHVTVLALSLASACAVHDDSRSSGCADNTGGALCRPAPGGVASLRARFPAILPLLDGASASAIDLTSSRLVASRPEEAGVAAARAASTARAQGARIARSIDRGVEAFFPATSDGELTIRPLRRGFDARAVRVRRRGAASAKSEIDGAVVAYRADRANRDYRDSHRPGDASYLFAVDGGIEELVVLAGAAREVVYDVAVPEGSRLRASGDVLEVLGADGTAWLRMTADAAWGASGERLRPEIFVQDRDTASGAGGGRIVHVRVPGDAVAPIVVDPKWSSTGRLAKPRHFHSATLLANGKVLIAGGCGGATCVPTGEASTLLDSAELYDPPTESFTLSRGRVLTPRRLHSATLLRSGAVLFAGGVGNETLDRAEVYEPATDRFSAVGGLAHVRASHTATLLGSGEVLIAGGRDGSTPPVSLADSELFDPTTGAFTQAATLAIARSRHTATTLRDGSVLFAGGETIGTVEIYDPISAVFRRGSTMTASRTHHTASLLPSGDVLIAGGRAVDLPAGAAAGLRAELFHPNGGAGTISTVESQNDARGQHTATLLTSGKVLLAGGVRTKGGAGGRDVTEGGDLFDPATETFSSMPPMVTKRYRHTATMLPSGKVLLVGGVDAFKNTLATAELFEEAPPPTPVPGPSMTKPHGGHTATLLPSGRVLIAGGGEEAAAIRSVDIYDPKMGTPGGEGGFVAMPPSMTRPRYGHTATLLRSGKVLLAGGFGASRTTETFDPGAAGGHGELRPGPTLSVGRAYHTATLLPTGEVLLAGGCTPEPLPEDCKLSVTSAELYDPVSDKLRPASPMRKPRRAHTATLLPSGKVLFAGGWERGVDPQLTTEIYEGSLGARGTFTEGPNMTVGRAYHAATVLSSGNVLVTGSGPLPTSSRVELFIPDSGPRGGRFEPASGLIDPRYRHSATLLPTGSVLVSGGIGSAAPSGTVRSLEVYEPRGGEGEDRTTPAGETPDDGDQPGTATLLMNGAVLLAGVSETSLWRPQSLARASRPVLTSPPDLAAVVGGEEVAVSGDPLADVAEGTGGGPSSSANNVPIALWMPFAGGRPLFGTLSPWSSTDARWRAPTTAFHGWGMLFVVSDGVMSAGKPVMLHPAAQGARCVFGTECASGRCADGVCCDRACAGRCEACSSTAKGRVGLGDGICEVVSEGIPHAACKQEAPSTCGSTGSCAADGRCATYVGTACGQGGVCRDGSCSMSSTCDGDATLTSPRGQKRSCAPYACNKSGECRSMCTSTGDCATHFVCNAGGACVDPGISVGDVGACAVGGGRAHGGGEEGAFLLLMWCGARQIQRSRRRPENRPR